MSSSDFIAAVRSGPTLLAVDTSSAWCSAALLRDGALQCIVERPGRGHSRRLLPMIEELLAQHGIEPGDCDAVGFGAGPGAFTGLRIACGVAQGLGWATRRPVIPVDCLAATALHARRSVAAGRPVAEGRLPAVAVVLDARMDQAYFALHGAALDAATPGRAASRPAAGTGEGEPGAVHGLQGASRIGDPRDAGAALLAEWRWAGSPPLVCAGDGFERYAEALAPLAAQAGSTLPAAHARADAVALCARLALAAGGRFDAADAAPRYVRDKVALDVHEQRALRAARTAAT